jgi:pimeloyl-ACP methyl ester carboxylesterase
VATWVRTRYADVGGSRVAYAVRGWWPRRGPWLVLVQGLGFDRYGWGPALRLLRRRFRLVLIDNRGSGRSDRPAGTWSVRDMAADIVAVLDAVGLPRAHLLGVSLGGMIAQEVAIRFPDRVDGLVLCCTTPGWPYAYPMPAQAATLLLGSPGLAEDVALRRNVENALAPQTVREQPRLVRRLVRHQRKRMPDRRAFRVQAAAGAQYTGQLRQSRISARTLVIHGSADRVVDPRNSKLIVERIPDARLLVLPGLGHLFFWEDPVTFVDAVSRFLLEEPPSRTH